jgi:hypothetical protein
MKKIFLCMLFSSICVVCSYGQALPSFQFGAKGGVNLTKFKTTNTFSSDNRGGYYAGIWARLGGAGLHLQPELYLSGKNSTLVTSIGQNNKVKFTNLDLPVLVGTKIGAAGFGVRLNAGPVISFNLDKEQNFDQAASAAFKGEFKDKTFALQFGVGLDIGKINADLRYEYGLSEINSTIYPTTKLNLFTLGIGFRIF